MKNLAFSLALLLLAFTATFAAGDQRGIGPRSADGVWQEIDTSGLSKRQAQRPIVPDSFRTFQLDLAGLQSLLARAPMEYTDARGGQVLLTLPMPDGTYSQFRIERSPVAEAGLIAKFPELNETFRGQGLDDPTATVRFDLLPSGFHAMILSMHGTVFVDPYATGDRVNYMSYNKSALSARGMDWKCQVVDRLIKNPPPAATRTPEVISGSQLRTYRLALSADNEYTVAVGSNTVAGALAAEVLIMNRVNGVYERDVAVHMNIVANNNLITFAGNLTSAQCGGVPCTAANDPFTDEDGEAMLAQNQAVADAVIGDANYDIGHVFSTGGGGIADLGVPCIGGFKAEGVTGLPTPVGDAFAIDFVAHEMGHQFGANHTFNTSCGGNRNAGTAYEPGSGITIMGYAGVCGAQDLALHSIDTFHVASLEEIVSYTQLGDGDFCAGHANSGNTPPTVSILGGSSYTIPKQTPFTLTATGNDVNGDTITYDWQEYDLGPATSGVPNTDAAGARAILRPYLPTSGARTFPQLSYILNNNNVPPSTYSGGFLTGELLPQIARTMSFQVIARDNHAGAGGINTATATVTIDGAGGPFAVTSPNTAVSWTGNTAQSVTWNVAGSSGAPVNAANVAILLSTDGGNTFPTTILASTPNDGNETITVPNVNTTTARIKVQAVNNIFFDISNANFTIVPGVASNHPVFDFDNDGKSDDAVTRDVGGNLTWYLLRSTSGFTGVSWGTTASDIAVPGDYDGDGKWDVAVFRSGTFHILQSSNGAYVAVAFGAAGDDPRISQDYDGDGKTDPAVTRNVGGVLTFYVLRSTAGAYGASFGTAATDVGVRGDFDGDHKADVALYRKNTGAPANTFFVLRSSDGVVTGTTFGNYALDYPVPGDFDGDSKTDFAVFRGRAGGDGFWYYLRSSNGAFVGQPFGAVGDQPVPGDYDGDGKSDPAVWRPGTPGTFYHLGSTSGVTGASFGATGDIPPGFALQAK